MNSNVLLRIAPFVAGIVLGVLGAVYLPGYVRPHLPDWMGGGSVVVTGTVAAKQKKDTSLLLTVETSSGVLLATFTRKVDEINLLINETDTIEFNLPQYKPFVDDPHIVRVAKEKKAEPDEAPAEKKQEADKKEEKPTKQEKPAKQEKQSAPASAPAQATGATGT